MRLASSVRRYPLRGLGFVLVSAVAGLAFMATTLHRTQPFIEFYTADRLAVDYVQVEQGVEAVNMSWRAVNVSDEYLMRMETWVGGGWVLVGEGFSAVKTDRIVVSHPLDFTEPLYRLTILSPGRQIVDERQLQLRYTNAETTPEIVQFMAPVRGGVVATALNSQQVSVPILWHVEGRGYRQQPVIEQVSMPGGEAISAPSQKPVQWLPRQGELSLPLLPVAEDTVFLRLRVIDTQSQQVLSESLITLPVVPDTSALPTTPVASQPDLSPPIREHVRAVYASGQLQGNDPHGFMRVGDSNIAGESALCNFARGNYDPGAYTDLQPIIDDFTDSFCALDAAAGRSFSSTSVLEPMWTTLETCMANETPLACNIRERHPAYALIYVGVRDVDDLSWNSTGGANFYRDNLLQIVSVLTDHGIIPVLSTFPTGYTFHSEGSAEILNAMIVDVAAEQQLPLIDLRSSTLLYPNRGVDVDGYHMSTPPGGRTSFTGNELIYARTLYELRVLETLRQLEQAVT